MKSTINLRNKHSLLLIIGAVTAIVVIGLVSAGITGLVILDDDAELERSNELLEQAGGEKIGDDPNFETFIDAVYEDSEALTIVFHHDSDQIQPIKVIGDIDYSLSANESPGGINVTLMVDLVDGEVPYFELHIGPESDVFSFGGRRGKVLLPQGLSASLSSDLETDVTKHKQRGIKKVVISDQEGYSGYLTIDFTGGDVDLLGLEADSDPLNARSVIDMDSWPAEVGQRDLLVPVVYDTEIVFICPGAKDLTEVFPGCDNEVILGLGQEVSGMTLSKIEIEGQAHYLVANVLGTGGGEFASSEAVDVSLAPISNTTFILAWIDRVEADASFKIMDTNGSVIVDTVDIETSVDSQSRISVAPINSTYFSVAWVDGPVNDAEYAIFDINGTSLVPESEVDTNVGTNTDISVAQLGDRYVVCYANDADNDADYKIYYNDGSQALGESRVDNNMRPESTLNNLVECAAINGTRWVYLWFDDAGNDVTYRMLSESGTFIYHQDVDTNAGNAGQVAVTSLVDAFAIAYYDDSENDITIAVRGIDNSVILGPTDIDSNAGEDSRIAIATTNDSFVVAWQDVNAGDIKAGVYNNSGIELTSPFTIDTEEDSVYKLLDVLGKDVVTGNSICDGTFLIAYTNSSNQGLFKGYYLNGTEWDGIACPSAAPSPYFSVIINLPENITYTTTGLELNTSYTKIIDQSWYSLNGGGNLSLCSASQYCNTSITGAEGPNNVTVWANDSLNTINSSTRWFSINTTDVDPPIIYPDVAINDTFVSTDELLKLNVTVDDNFEVDTVLFEVSGSLINYTAQLDGTEAYYYWACNQSGNYSWVTIYSNDTSNNWNSTSNGLPLNWTCDTDLPIVQNVSATPTSVPILANVNLKCDAYDAGGISNVWYEISENTDTSPMTYVSGNTYAANYSTLIAGEYTFECHANDTTGIEALNTAPFTVGAFDCVDFSQEVGHEYNRGDTVLISSLVKDTMGNPLSGAVVNHTIRYPNLSIYKALTSTEIVPGYYKASFTIGDEPYGNYQVEGQATYGTCVDYADSVFLLEEIDEGGGGGVLITASSEENYDKSETVIITATVQNPAGSLYDPDWVNVTITHRDSSTVYVTNSPMNSSGETGFYYYAWSIPSDADCGGYEARLKTKVEGVTTGTSTTFTVSCWITRRLGLDITNLDNSFYGFDEVFSITADLSAEQADLQDCRAEITFLPSGLELPDEDAAHWVGDYLEGNSSSTDWSVKGSKSGAYNITVQGLCSYGVSDSDTLTNITIKPRQSVFLSKYFSPDIILANTVQEIETNITLKNNDTNPNEIYYVNIIDEVPEDFVFNLTSPSVWFVNDSAEVEITSYSLSFNDPLISLTIPNLTLTQAGQYLGQNESVRLSYYMNSSLMSHDDYKDTLTNATVINQFNSRGYDKIRRRITALRVLLRGFKDIYAPNASNPQSVIDYISMQSLGGAVNNLTFSDYLPIGVSLTNVDLFYYNSTSDAYTSLVNNTDYSVSLTNGTLPDGNPAYVYQYNLSLLSPANWDNNLYSGDEIIMNNSVALIGGGTWTLPAVIAGFDPTYQKHITTETHTDYSVPLFDVLLDVLTQIVNPGEVVKALVTLLNVGGPQAMADVLMTYAIKDTEGETVIEKSETLAVLSQKERNISMLLPRNMDPGYYNYEALATYVGREALAADMFEVIAFEAAGLISRNDIFYYGLLALLGLGIAASVKKLIPKGYFKKKRKKK